MNKTNSLLLFAVLFLVANAFGASSLPSTTGERIAQAKAIFRGTVLEKTSFRNPDDGGIYTKTILRVDEVLKGKFPRNIQLVHRGGIVDGEGFYDSFAPDFSIGEERLVFLDERADKTLFAFDGGPSAILLHRKNSLKSGAPGDFVPSQLGLLEEIRQTIANPAGEGIDVTGQADSPSGLSTSVLGGLTQTNGISSRFTQPDRGEKIGYIVDAQVLPPGISLSQALNAVSNALAAWSQASSAQFVFEGMQNFGNAAPLVAINDRKIRIQLHDLYGYISGTNVLGIGGRNYAVPGGLGNAGGFGGKIGSREFFLNNRGFLVLKHTRPALQDLSTFEEVICHEIGHVLSLDHSSETDNEPNSTLAHAMMYYKVHGNGRGATLGEYDGPIVRMVHPLNTPPYGYDRVMHFVHAPWNLPSGVGINEIELRGYDLQGDSLTLSLTNQTSLNGSFSLVGNILKFTPLGYFGPNDETYDPNGSTFFELAYARFSDGTNSSPFIRVRGLSLLGDTRPDGNPDGVPDQWMTRFFGNIDPAAGTKRQATDDFDGDGVSNQNEFLSGTNPTDANSVLRINHFSKTNLQFIAKPYEVYEIQTSSNLVSWSLATNPVSPTVTNAAVSGFADPSASQQFFRVLKVP